MSLPRIKYPIYDTEIPSTKKRVKYRPMTVKEEKVLLIARESEEQSQVVTALAQVVNNCLLEKVEIGKMPIFDVEFLFLQIRMHSVSDVAKVSFKDNEDEQTRDWDIDLTKVPVKFPEVYSAMIKEPLKIGNEVAITLKAPSVDDFAVLDLSDSSPDAAFKIVASCIETVNDETFNKHTAEEQMEFIEQIPSKEFDKIKLFFENIPRLNHVIKYTNKNGKERTIVLDSLVDFFTV